MNTNIVAVLLSCILYSLYVLLPMIPAIVIYRMFPDTKVALSGPLANLTIKSTGAFAAYVVVVFLGYSLIKSTDILISRVAQPSIWHIEAMLELQDTEGKKLDDQGPLKDLKVTVEPDFMTHAGNYVGIDVPSTGAEKPDRKITFTIPYFQDTTIKIDDLKYEEDSFNRVLRIKSPIPIPQLRTSGSPYTGNGYLQPSGLAKPQ